MCKVDVPQTNALKIHSDDLATRFIWNINILHRYIHDRLQSAQNQSDFLLRIVIHLLSKDTQGSGCDAKD